jgi:hypothetical protein
MAADFVISIKNLMCKSKVVPVFHKQHNMKMYMGVEVYLLAIVISALNRDEWLALSPGRSPCIHWTRGWVGAGTT